jgi:N-acetyl-anhydromuramyl-L-alanine amidase AmpD
MPKIFSSQFKILLALGIFSFLFLNSSPALADLAGCYCRGTIQACTGTDCSAPAPLGKCLQANTTNGKNKLIESAADCNEIFQAQPFVKSQGFTLASCTFDTDGTCSNADKDYQASLQKPDDNLPTDTIKPIISIKKPVLEILIPNLTFSDIKSTTDENGNIQIPWIGEYIAAVYRLAVTVASILSVILIIREGALIAVSGGGEEKINGLRNIGRIIAGLILAWSSYVILYNINASLVSFRPLDIKFVDATLGDDHSCDDPNECKTTATSTSGSIKKGKCDSDLKFSQQGRTDAVMSKLNFTLFGQVDSRTYGKRMPSDIRLIVIHNGGYTAQGNNDTWQKRPAAAHYTIDRNGVVYQHADEQCIVPHAPGGNEIGSANRNGIGIELNIDKYNGRSCNSLTSLDPPEGIKAACSPTQAQYNSLKLLVADIVARTKAVVDSKHIIGHCEAVSAKGHGDPRAFDWTQIGLNNEEKKQQAQGHACSWYLPF